MAKETYPLTPPLQGKGRKARTPDERAPRIGDFVPAPYDHLYVGRDPEEDRLVTTLMLAGEALADLTPQPPSLPARSSLGRGESVPHAKPVDNDRPTILEDFEGLKELVGQINAWLAEDPRRAEWAARTREAFGDGEMLRVLFRNLFPGQVSRPSRDADGKPVLTDKQVAVLREAAGDRSQKGRSPTAWGSRRRPSTSISGISTRSWACSARCRRSPARS